MGTNYATRLMLYDAMMILSLIVLGYALSVKLYGVSVAFCVIAYVCHRGLIKTMKNKYIPPDVSKIL